MRESSETESSLPAVIYNVLLDTMPVRVQSDLNTSASYLLTSNTDNQNRSISHVVTPPYCVITDQKTVVAGNETIVTFLHNKKKNIGQNIKKKKLRKMPHFDHSYASHANNVKKSLQQFKAFSQFPHLLILCMLPIMSCIFAKSPNFML